MGRISYWGVTVVILLFGAGIIGVVYVVVPSLRPRPAQIDPDADERARRERAVRVCEETRARVIRGAVIGATDVEGWVTELVLLRAAGTEGFVSARDLAGVVDQGSEPDSGRFIWKDAPELAAIDSGSVTVGDATLEANGQHRPGLRLTFARAYVTAYFREEERPPWVRAAGKLASHLRATHGALYARCATGNAHHLGSWFLGPGPNGAAATLLYFMGAHADVPHVSISLLQPDGGTTIDRGFALERLTAATRSLDRAQLGVVLGPHGGMIGGAAGSTSLTFPFRDADRAARASRDLAQNLGIGAER